MAKLFFAADGSWGDATGLVILDCPDFIQEIFEDMDPEDRLLIATKWGEVFGAALDQPKEETL